MEDEITDSKQDGDYRDIELYSEKYEAWAYIYTPTNEISGERWTNELQKCSGNNVFLSLIERSNPQASLCFEDKNISGQDWGVVSFIGATQ